MWLRTEELVRIEQHWTQQVQNQQQRVSTLLTVTGILLAFLAGAGFLTEIVKPHVGDWSIWAWVYFSSLVTLCFALLMGICALNPRIPIAKTSREAEPSEASGALWLDAQAVWAQAQEGEEERLLTTLCESLVASQKNAKHSEAQSARRKLMNRQIQLLVLALLLLVIALAGFGLQTLVERICTHASRQLGTFP